MLLDKILSLIRKIFVRSVPSRLFILGSALIMPGIGLFDVVLYVYDTFILKKIVSSPNDVINWHFIIAGLFFIFIALVIWYKQYRTEIKNNIRDKRTKFKEEFDSYSDVRKQDEVERLYNIRNADIRSINNVFRHPYNPNEVIALFSKCHRYVLPSNSWLITNGNYMSFRAFFTFVIWLAYPVLMLVCVYFIIMEVVYLIRLLYYLRKSEEDLLLRQILIMMGRLILPQHIPT